ncbi:MAG: UDP-N-acetylmuramate dehydrogenase [Fimbriimonadaceae bacterium]
MTPSLFNRRLSMPLSTFTTLRAGGMAHQLYVPKTVDELVELVAPMQLEGPRPIILGWGSNVLPSDRAFYEPVVINLCRAIEFEDDGRVVCDTGYGFQDLCLATLKRGLRGLEFAVGIPGTVGGALVSNAGAYRSNVSEFVTGIEILEGGERKWVDPSWMNFSYRDSAMRSLDPPPVVLLRVALKLPKGDIFQGFEEARDYQRQRISKQPPPASAGSFFKNVLSESLARSLPTLPEPLKKAGVVPAGYLLENVDMRGFRHRGAMFSNRHANFLINARSATATDLRRLADIAKARVMSAYEVELEEEVLFIGDWSDYQPR